MTGVWALLVCVAGVLEAHWMPVSVDVGTEGKEGTRFVAYDAIVMDVFVDRNLFLHGVPLGTVYDFTMLHHHHQQIMYGIAHLDCGDTSIPTFPTKGRHTGAQVEGTTWTEPLMMHSLPISEWSHFAWLNALSRHLYPSHQFRHNRLTFAILLNSTQTGSQEMGDPIISQVQDRCTLHIHDQVDPDGEFSSVLHDRHGNTVALDIPLTSQNRQEIVHVHMFQHETMHSMSSIPSSFLSESTSVGSIPFLDLLLPPIMDQIEPRVIPYVSNNVMSTLQQDISKNVAGALFGVSSPGAGPPEMSGIGAFTVPANMGGGAASLILEQEVYQADANGYDITDGSEPSMLYASLTASLLEVTASKGIKEEKNGKMVEQYAKALLKALDPHIAAKFTESSVDKLTASLAPLLRRSLLPFLRDHLNHDLPDLLVPPLQQLLNEIIPPFLTRTLVESVGISVADESTKDITTGVSHAIIPALLLTEKYAHALMECDSSTLADSDSCSALFEEATRNLQVADALAAHFGSAEGKHDGTRRPLSEEEARV